jgi:hypothetical protein
VSFSGISFSWPFYREYENLKEARKASGELADKLKKDLASSRSKVAEQEAKNEEGEVSLLSCSFRSPELGCEEFRMAYRDWLLVLTGHWL